MDFVGTAGADSLLGGSAADLLQGLSGNDTLDGGAASDSLEGGSGDDLLIVADHPVDGERFDGGDGLDTLLVRQSSGSSVNLEGVQFLTLLNGTVLSSIEKLAFDSLEGSVQSIVIDFAQIGAGLAPAATLIGSSGTDRLVLLASSAGTYTVPGFVRATNWGQSGDGLTAGDGVGLSALGNGNFVLNASAGHVGIEALSGGNGNDTLNGSDGIELLSGGGGFNQLHGNGGDDVFTMLSASLNPTSDFPLDPKYTGEGSLFDGGAGNDSLSIRGPVEFRGTVQSIERIYLQPATSSAAPTELFLSSTTISVMGENLILGGVGKISVQMAEGGSLDASAYTFSPNANVAFAIGGTEDAEAITGTTSGDFLGSVGGNDTVSGGQGDDIIVGGTGDDNISGGTGHDYLYGGDLDGGSAAPAGGNDTLLGGDGNDHIYGNSLGGGNNSTDGADLIDAGNGADYVNGNGGNDSIGGGAGSDRLLGGRDNDTLMGGGDADRLNGNTGDDSVSGGDGNDLVRGGQGNDVVRGDGGNDILLGDLGNDTLIAGAGVDVMTGGTGEDRFDLSAANAGNVDLASFYTAVTDFEQGVDRLYLAFQVGTGQVLQAGNFASVAAAQSYAQTLLTGHTGTQDVAAAQVGSAAYLFYNATGTDKQITSIVALFDQSAGNFDQGDFS